MELTLKRIARQSTYTIGRLYVDGEYVCDTIEDVDRGIKSTDDLAHIAETKVKHATAIPIGTYPVVLHVRSPKYSKYRYYKQYCDGYLPRLLNVPGFEGILIHTGNTAADSSGCIIVGHNLIKGRLVRSRVAFEALYTLLREAASKNEPITITIV